ncbi:MAG: hypothetical protein IT534_06120 [Bauldia sp.]|nr:hypothetical protein [Bauldia sp.]
MDNAAPNLARSEDDAADEAESLLKQIAEVRDEALRLKFSLAARLLDMAALEVTSYSNNRK